MELKLVLRMLWRRWYLILIPAVVVAFFVVPDMLGDGPAVSGGFTTTIRYSAAQELNLPDRDGDYQDVWLASELTVNAFTEWVRSNSFREELRTHAATQGIDLSSLSIVSDNARSIGVITLSYPDAETLRMLADAALDVLRNRNQVYFPQLGGDPARVTLLDEPVILPAPPPLANRFAPLIRLGVALVVGVGLATLAEYLDQRIRGREELEGLGLRVMVTIPKHRG